MGDMKVEQQGVRRLHHESEMRFEPAIAEMKRLDKSVFGPMAYREYRHAYGLIDSGSRQTATHISIDAFNLLPAQLRAEDTMVIRLGQGIFVLTRCPGALREFFLFDDELFPSKGAIFMPSMTAEELIPYKLLPSLTEGGLVNFAFASGVLHHALNLDAHTATPPATSQSTFTFDFKAHPSIPTIFTHRSGQVEIDAMFVATRNNRPTLFVIEAKADETTSLAKHKLLYPILAVFAHVPKDMPIIPVYIRINCDTAGYHFRIAECIWESTPISHISGIQVVSSSHWILPI